MIASVTDTDLQPLGCFVRYIKTQNARMHQGKAQEADIERQTDGWTKAHQALFNGWVHTAAAAAAK